MSVGMRLLHWVLRVGSERIMLPSFESLGGTRDAVLGGRLCVLRTVGRKSGLPREIPLNYAPTTRGVALLAGFGRGTGWVYDLRSRPGTEVLVGERVHRATAVEISDPLRARLATRAVLRNDGAAGFFYGWDPRRASDARIDAVVEQTSCFQLVFYEPPPWQPTQHDTVTGR